MKTAIIGLIALIIFATALGFIYKTQLQNKIISTTSNTPTSKLTATNVLDNKTDDEQEDDVVIVADSLKIPWDIAFLPDKSILVTEPDFRTISERTNVLTNADLVETILNADILEKTKSKINDVTGGNYDYLLMNDNLFDYYIGRKLYHNNLLTNKNFLKQKYSVDYFVVESDFEMKGSELVYENSKYKIYR